MFGDVVNIEMTGIYGHLLETIHLIVLIIRKLNYKSKCIRYWCIRNCQNKFLLKIMLYQVILEFYVSQQYLNKKYLSNHVDYSKLHKTLVGILYCVMIIEEKNI